MHVYTHTHTHTQTHTHTHTHTHTRCLDEPEGVEGLSPEPVVSKELAAIILQSQFLKRKRKKRKEKRNSEMVCRKVALHLYWLTIPK